MQQPANREMDHPTALFSSYVMGAYRADKTHAARLGHNLLSQMFWGHTLDV